MVDDILMDEKVLKLRREIKALMKSAGKDYEIEKELWQHHERSGKTLTTADVRKAGTPLRQ